MGPQLRVPKLSSVPHPFTIVPGATPDQVQLFVKASGKFTAGLARELSEGAPGALRFSLQGPYAAPPIPSALADAAVFVFGGVGITPGLSLVAAACEKGKLPVGSRARVFWAVRSPGLVKRCAPLLVPHLDPKHDCVCLDGCAEDGVQDLPSTVTLGRRDVTDWMAAAATQLAEAGASTVLLFICGPESLTRAAKQATSKATAVKWLVHAEEFLFLPNLLPARGGNRAPVAPKVPPAPAKEATL